MSSLNSTDVADLTVPGGPDGDVAIRIVRPPGATGTLPVIIFVYGAGWAADTITQDRLIRELAASAGAAVVFADYRYSTEIHYECVIEESYTAAQWVVEHGAEHGLDSSRMAVAGDSVGGNMAAALRLVAKERSGPRFTARVLFELRPRLDFTGPDLAEDAGFPAADVEIAVLDRPVAPPRRAARKGLHFVYMLHPEGVTIDLLERPGSAA